MTMTGAEIGITARLLAPLIRDLYTASKGSVQAGLKKWSVEKYSEQLVRKITSVESVKTLWQFEKEVAYVIFIIQSVF
jgi:hypothetical protein